ncbi:MAG: FAD-binding protein [Patescibacteria group bacterium]
MKFLENVSLAEYTTFKIGGKARYFCVVKNEDELREALNFVKGKKMTGKNAKDEKMSFFVLGGGSNILVSDRGFPGLVIKMEMVGISFENMTGENAMKKDGEVLVTAGAGENWDELAAETVKRSLWGLENLSGIPGTVGAAPVQNIGAYGAEVGDFIVSVRAVDVVSGAARTFPNSECQFSYRESFFKTSEGKKYIITSVTFKLSRTPKPNLSYKDLKEYFEKEEMEKMLFVEHAVSASWRSGSFSGASCGFVPRQTLTSESLHKKHFLRLQSLPEIRKAVIKIRKTKFPELSKIGTAGSFWKNPVISKPRFEELKAQYPNMPSFPSGDQIKIPLAWILDNICNLKGFTLNSVSLWQNQPLVVTALKGATSSDVKSLAVHVSRTVKEKIGIDIEKEVQYVN